MFELIVNVGVPLLLLVVAMVTGTWLENRHFKSIREREANTAYLPTLSGRAFPADKNVLESRLVQGSAVISVDYFKRFLAGLRMIFGGELGSYASLLDRARREAILRMKAEWPNAELIVNVRIETSSVAKGQGNSIGCTEVLAYGTAIQFQAQEVLKPE